MPLLQLLLLLLLPLHHAHAGQAIPPPDNLRPIVGILSVPLAVGGCCTVEELSTTTSTSCFHSIYVKWLESSGARVVPIRFDLPDAELIQLAQQVNAVLFTGGDTPIIHTHSQYMHAAGLLLNHTAAANDHFPLWGTCMGIQTLSVLTAGTASVLESGIFTGVDPQMMSLNLTTVSTGSRLLGTTTTPSSVLKSLQHSKVTTNLHHDGVAPSSYQTNTHLNNFFNVLSTNHDTSGHPFVSTIEAKTLPIFAVQWHPERPQFDWTYDGKLNHNLETIETMQYFSNFFVNEARRNQRHFLTTEEEMKALIYNYSPTVSGSSYQAYLF